MRWAGVECEIVFHFLRFKDRPSAGLESASGPKSLLLPVARSWPEVLVLLAGFTLRETPTFAYSQMQARAI